MLTDTGQLAMGYAQEIFSLGSELEAAVREKTRQGRTIEFRVGVADVVPKSIAFHLVKPALQIAGGNQSKAARMAGIPRRTFLEKMRRYGLNPKP